MPTGHQLDYVRTLVWVPMHLSGFFRYFRIVKKLEAPSPSRSQSLHRNYNFALCKLGLVTCVLPTPIFRHLLLSELLFFIRCLRYTYFAFRPVDMRLQDFDHLLLSAGRFAAESQSRIYDESSPVRPKNLLPSRLCGY